jgi:hypothetical protein
LADCGRQDGPIFIELINAPFLYDHKGSPAEYGAGPADI